MKQKIRIITPIANDINAIESLIDRVENTNKYVLNDELFELIDLYRDLRDHIIEKYGK